MTADKLRIAINAQLIPGRGAGGIESVLIGLIAALGQLNDGAEEYVVIGPWEKPDWLAPYLGSNQHIVCGPRPSQVRGPGPLELFKRVLGPLRSKGRRVWRELFPVPVSRVWPEVPVSDGFYEELGCHVIHFPWQPYTVCAMPAVYNPHDLQHVHFPEFFSPIEIAWREITYRTGCNLAQTVVVGSTWVKDDLVKHFSLHPGKVQVIPWAPPTQAYTPPSPESLERVQARYSLQPPFALYPAMTWEHKNHLRLLTALAHLRDREGLAVRLVCTGHRHPAFWPRIEQQLHMLRLDDHVQFLGIVSPGDLRAIYRLAQFVIVPTLFEAASGPVFEAWLEGTAVACSTVTSLPEQVGGAALLFDPFSVEAIAGAIRCMTTDAGLRSKMISKGTRRLQNFRWDRTAKAYRAVYRQVAHQPLTEEDQRLLSWNWMRDPEI